MAGNIVLAMNKLRYKDGKGDPKGFVNFLDNHSLPHNIIPRYRGNRLHIIFHTCHVFLENYELFSKFLTIGTVSCGGLQSSLREAFCNPTGIKEMCVLAVMGKLLTGPWMREFYVSVEKATHDLESAINCIRKVLLEIQDCKAKPAGLYERKVDFFGKDVDLTSLTCMCSVDDQLLSMTSVCLQAVDDVLSRQYKKYFTMTITDTLRQETETARLHNIDSEELMGMFSAAKVKSLNSTLDFLSSKLRSKKNKTVEFLENLDLLSRERVVKWSMQTGRRQRYLHGLRLTELRQEISKRQASKQQKKTEQEKHKVEKELGRLSKTEILTKYKDISPKQLTDLEDVLCDRIVGRKLCLEHQVPVERAGHLVHIILKELTDTTIAKVPAPSTVAQMAYEMGIICNLQVAEILYNSPPETVATLCWDATTIDGNHFNEINVSLDGKTYTIEIGQLEGGATLDYFRHIKRSIKDLATVFSTFSGIDQHMILYKFRTLINTTLTDRAPVNSCVSDELSELFCKELIKLNCNLQPLDGMATEAKKVLKNFDVNHGVNSAGIFGQDGKAANLVHAVSKLRYKMSSGDPAIFKSFLRMSNLNVGLIARYVGNRLHILFHSAGIVVHLKDLLLLFLKKYCKDNPFRLSLIKDLENPLIITQLRALGLFGKMLTGPWMTLFYKNRDRLKHLELVPSMQLCVDRLKEIALSPGFLLKWPTDCFDQALDMEDHVLRALREVVVDQVFAEVAKALAEGFCKVLERQLEPYLKGRLSVVTPQLRLMTSSAPLHNMHSERALGMFDSQSHRARNATVGYREGKVKFVLNKTMLWLETKAVDQQQSIITHARKFATKKRKQMMVREKKILEAAEERLKLMAQRRDTRERAKLEKGIKAGNQDCFQDLTTEAKFLCDMILAGSQSLVGRTLHHIWADGNEDKVYQGVVSKIQGSNVFILYSSETKPTKLTLYGLVADIIMGDATFVA